MCRLASQAAKQFSPKGLHSKAQGRAAHPGKKHCLGISTPTGLNERRIVCNPFRVLLFFGSLTQGALRDPGLWSITPLGYIHGAAQGCTTSRAVLAAALVGLSCSACR